MQGIILTGGKGSRLRPLTNNTNKHLLNINGLPMIYYSLSIFVAAGVDEINLISNAWQVDDFKSVIHHYYGDKFKTIRIIPQTNHKPGIAGSIQELPSEHRRGPYMLVLADNLIGGSITEFRKQFDKNPDKALILLSEVQSPKSFGVVHMENEQIKLIEEKPETEDSHYAITGIYFFPEDLIDIAAKVQPSRRGEYEITDVLEYYRKSERLDYAHLPFWWIDAGTHETLARARELLSEG